MRHTFLFTRTEGMLGVTTAAVLTISTEGPAANSHEEAFKRFKNAVSDWLNETAEGRDHWEDTNGDFNIGDAGMAGLRTRDTFVPFQERYGITIHEMDSIAWDHQVPYDTVLNNVRD